MKAVTFYNGEETKPVIEGIDRFNDSMFHDYLEHALKLVENQLSDDSHDESKSSNDNYDNNIISFLGERGSGKTSCMYSLMKCLKDIDSQRDINLQGIDTNKIKRAKLSFLKTIDPSFFDLNHNILEMVIGEMYSEIVRNIDKGIIKDEDQIQRLLKKFGEAKRDMHYIGKDIFDKEPDQELEELQYLSSGVNLRETFKNLIDSFLEWKGSGTLVISIDDIDLNTKQAYPMVEQIRKYLILPNVIVLIAVKLDQLSNVIKQEMMERFSKLLDSREQAIGLSEISEMAERYLNKLLPVESRIYLPTTETYFNAPLIIKVKNGKNPKFPSVREAVPSLIFQKCRYLFYNTKGTTSYIVPRNLRDFRLLIQMLMEMEDYVKTDNDKESPTFINKTQFKRYFFDTWLNTLDPDCRNVAKHLIEETEPAQFNKQVIDLLKDMYSNTQNSQIKQRKDILEKKANDKNVSDDSKTFTDADIFNDIIDEKNVSYNVSLGDTFYILDYIERIETNGDVKRLIFFIKSLYSIKLYEYYDDFITGEKSLEISNTPKSPYRGERLENIPDYEKLIGGNFFLLSGDTILPATRSGRNNKEREIHLIDGNKLFTLLKNVESEYAQVPKDQTTTNSTDNSNTPQLIFTEEFKSKLRTVEFFMLTTLRYVWAVNKDLKESGIHKYRVQSDAYYDRAISDNTKNLQFDVLEPFFTLIDIEHAYGRFSKTIFSIAKDVEDSLYNRLIAEVPDDDRSYLSRNCIRNSEILDDLFLKLRSSRGNHRTGSSDAIIKDLYNDISKYGIASYDPGKDTKYYKITFPSFKVLSKLFDDSVFVQNFNDIYNRVD